MTLRVPARSGMARAMRLAVTTALGAAPDLTAAGRAAAARHGAAWLERGGATLAELCRSSGAEALLVLERRGVALFAGGEERRYGAGMGMLRARRLACGERSTADAFLEAAGLRPGDEVLDCTVGLGADALVAAEAVGPAGRVVALESSPVLAAWVAEGLARLSLPAARRVEVRRADHGAALAELPDRSFDVVAFDPMFRRPGAEAPPFDVVRRFADPRPLSAAALEGARRVARRWVVVKDAVPGWDLARLGLSPMPSSRAARRLYARLAATD